MRGSARLASSLGFVNAYLPWIYSSGSMALLVDKPCMRHYDNGYNRLTDCPTKLVHITEKLVLPPLSCLGA